MKLRKIHLIRLLQSMMESYNAFTSVESLDRKADAWHDKLQYQNEEFVTKAMSDWHGAKMPTAIDILKKCFELNNVRESEYVTHNLVCEYYKHSHAWEEECEISKSLCHNRWNEEEKNNINLCNFDLNGNVFMVCSFHRRKLMAIFENSESCKFIVEGLMANKKQSTHIDLYKTTKDLTNKIRFDLK